MNEYNNNHNSNDHYPFVNTPLPYSYDAMEPYIDARTMELHHNKHLQAYVDNLNQALADYPRLHRLSLEELILNVDCLPAQIRTQVWRNGGGVFNHRFFFQGLHSTPSLEPEADSPLGKAIHAAFGSLGQFKSRFHSAALSVFGSGYAWLAADRRGSLKIVTTANQDTPLTEGLCPILTIDVWEHAYYLRYQNRRTEYIENWFQVIDWQQAARHYANCRVWGQFCCC